VMRKRPAIKQKETCYHRCPGRRSVTGTNNGVCGRAAARLCVQERALRGRQSWIFLSRKISSVLRLQTAASVALTRVAPAAGPY
jgi:hypothetical protein